jgi:hypothetical protein
MILQEGRIRENHGDLSMPMSTDSKMVVMALAMLGLLSPVGASAEYYDEDMLKVTVRIQPNIAVEAGPDVDMTALQAGEVSGDFPFRVESNSQEIEISVQASHLYKGSDPNSLNMIELSKNEQAEIFVKGANPRPYKGTFSRAVDVHGGFRGYVADPVIMESGDRGFFSNDMEIGLTWTNNDPELPVGQYTGYVKVIGVVLPGSEE